ncbi:competence type IV pilus minor pilin ComGD [Oceanobacillus rekensis]|uniref:competence type IV pilus minor pilin ComGD n=1 Tax=Oceanobacillus rekensis TaxID=937927 RepID=UPI000B430D02|nr:competence type IV pilus minor pilin ComGD [Oceanobacillus rekensis]
MSPYQRIPNGFTLLEVLFVLTLLSVVLVLLPPINVDVIAKQQEKQFIETFQFDVLYVQNMSNLITNEEVFIRLYKDNYKILRGSSETIAERTYPPGLVIDPRGNADISFNTSGTFIYPRTIRITTKNNDYNAVFQLGKGRFYIAER